MKNLFFAALVAVAAIGSASAFPVYNSNGQQIGDCNPNVELNCVGDETFYESDGQTLIQPGDLLERQYEPIAPTL